MIRALFLLGLCAATLGDRQPETAGPRPFFFGMTVGEDISGRDTVAADSPLKCRVQVGTRSESCRAIVSISVPDNLEAIGTTEDTLLITRDTAYQNRIFDFQLRARSIGSAAVVGRATFTYGDTAVIDEQTFVLQTAATPTRLIAGPIGYMRPTRKNRSGTWQYIPGWLIPVDRREDIVELGEGPQLERSVLLHGPAARCIDCSRLGYASGTVKFIVVIGRDGRVRAARLLDGEAASLAGDALTQWRFKPARLNGRNVSDWQIVSVPVIVE